MVTVEEALAVKQSIIDHWQSDEVQARYGYRMYESKAVQLSHENALGNAKGFFSDTVLKRALKYVDFTNAAGFFGKAFYRQRTGQYLVIGHVQTQKDFAVDTKKAQTLREAEVQAQRLDHKYKRRRPRLAEKHYMHPGHMVIKSKRCKAVKAALQSSQPLHCIGVDLDQGVIYDPDRQGKVSRILPGQVKVGILRHLAVVTKAYCVSFPSQ